MKKPNPSQLEYYENSKNYGMLDWNEMIAAFQQDRVGMKTWFKEPQDIYWKELRNIPEWHPEIFHASSFDYIVDKHIVKGVLGNHLLQMYANDEIHYNTYVKFSHKENWQTLAEVFFSKKEIPSVKLDSFQGYSSAPLDECVDWARKIDGILFYLFLVLCIYIGFVWVNVDWPFYQNLKVFVWYLLSMFFFVPIIEACCVTIFGGTLGLRMFGLRALNLDGSKLSLKKSLIRQLFITYRCYKRSWKPVAQHAFLSGNRWDISNGVVVTYQKPKC